MTTRKKEPLVTPRATLVTPRTMGVIGLGHIDMVPGAAAHPATYAFPTIIRWLAPDLLEPALRADPQLYPIVLAQARELVTAGADMVMTTCGYFTPYQRDLSRDLGVPALTSALTQLPSIQNLIGERKVLIVAANAAGVDSRCLTAAGALDHDRIVVRGLQNPGPFQAQVLAAGGLHDIPAIITQTVDLVREALSEDPDISAICLECGDLTLTSEALREQIGLPTFDYVTAADWFYASTHSRR